MTGDKVSSILGLLLALFILREGVRIDLGGIHQPGPGFFMFAAGMLLAVCSAIVLVRSLLFKAKGKDSHQAAGGGNLWLAGYVLGALFVYAFVFEWLGFIVATFFLVLFLLLILEPKKWWQMLITAGLISVVAFAIFNLFLKSGLPEGILGF